MRKQIDNKITYIVRPMKVRQRWYATLTAILGSILQRCITNARWHYQFSWICWAELFPALSKRKVKCKYDIQYNPY